MPTHPWDTLLKLVSRGALFHVVDVETTGLSAQTDRVIELATVTLRDGEVVDRFSTLVNPGMSVSSTTTRITGIRTSTLEHAPTPATALRRWLAYVGEGGYFVAHNAAFDWGFLKAECARAGLDFPFKRKFCTMKLAGHFFPYGGRLKLEHTARRFGVEAPGGTHRALADAEAAAGLFLKAIAHLQAGTRPAPSGLARPEAPFDASGDPWEAVLRYIKQSSLVTASILGQHGTNQGRGEDGALQITLSPEHFRFLDNPAERARLEEAVHKIYGEDTAVRLGAVPPMGDDADSCGLPYSQP